MWFVLIAVVLVVAGVVAVTVLRRPSGNDLSSVKKYHSALGTIEHLAERIDQSPAKVAGFTDGSNGDHVSSTSDGGQGTEGPDGIEDSHGTRAGAGTTGRVRTAPGASRSVPPIPVRANDELPDPEYPLVFDDSRPRDRYHRGSSSQGASVSRTDRAQKHALESMNHRPRRGTAVTIVVAALALFGALAYAGSRRSNSTNHSHSRVATSSVSATSSSTARTTNPTSTSSTASGSSHQGGHTKKHGGKTKTTPTTTPTQIVALSSTSGSAIYPVSSTTYSVTVSASGPCWVLATTTSSGSTLWTGTLKAGAVQLIQATGAISVELGAPSVSLAVGNVPVVLPTPVHTPFVATFQPATATPPVSGTAPATPSTATTTTIG
jgi:hypothetical protein